jgi:hypothetical protein
VPGADGGHIVVRPSVKTPAKKGQAPAPAKKKGA